MLLKLLNDGGLKGALVPAQGARSCCCWEIDGADVVLQSHGVPEVGLKFTCMPLLVTNHDISV